MNFYRPICLIMLAWLSAPAYAHLVPFADPALIDAAGGDEVKASKLSAFCFATGKPTNCLSEVLNNDQIKIDAALKCHARIQRPIIIDDKSSADGPDERIAHKRGGGDGSGGETYHMDYKYSKEDGMHRYDYTPALRQVAQDRFYNQLLKEHNENRSNRAGNPSTSTSTSASGGMGIDKTHADGTITQTTTTQLTPMSLQERADIASQSRAAYNDPAIVGIKPDAICSKNDRICSSSSSVDLINKDYKDPGSSKSEDKKEEPKDSSKDSDKKNDSSTSTSHETSSSRESSISYTDHGKWAGEPTPSRPGEMWATPVLDDFGQKTVMEICMEREAKKLSDYKGSTHVDQSLVDILEERKKEAEANLLKGHCDARFFGNAFCQKFKNDRDSTFVPDSDLDRAEALKEAQKNLELSGVCNSRILGADVCRKQRQKLDTTYFCDFATDPSCKNQSEDTALPTIESGNNPLDLDFSSSEFGIPKQKSGPINPPAGW